MPLLQSARLSRNNKNCSDFPDQYANLLNKTFGSILKDNILIQIPLTGKSMFPSLKEGDLVTVKAIKAEEAHPGDILAYQDIGSQRIVIHRFVKFTKGNGERLMNTIGEAGNLSLYDPPIAESSHVIGKVIRLRRGRRIINLESIFQRRAAYLRALLIRYAPISIRIQRKAYLAFEKILHKYLT